MPKSAKLRRSPQQDRGIESRDKILAGAKKVLSQEVTVKLSMRKISRASGVGLSTIYDYFPSKSSVLHTLLEERLKLKLQIFDRTIEESSSKEKLSEFIDHYLERMREEDFWSVYDMGLEQAAQNDNGLQALMDWYEAETIDRYVRALRLAGSTWPEAELRTVALYLLSVWAKFGPDRMGVNADSNPKLMEKLVRVTFSAVLKEVLS
ncbi:hypothetical protein A8B75_06675 [Sphingomonadales bacterium EhC05]|nr:hypothetical protein A8B75_06675 [Sphingomonadales bacterium EhC05]